MSFTLLHIIPSYFPAYRYGGPIKIVHQLNKWLVKKGCDVTVYTTNIDGPNNLNVSLNKLTNIDGVKVFYFPITFRPWQYSYKLHKALIQNIKNFDLIHITSVFLSASTLGAYYAKKFNKPYIISPHGSFMADPLRHKALKKKIYISFLEKRNLRDAAAIHFVAENEKTDYLKAGLPLNQELVISNGLDEEEFGIIPERGYFRKKYNIPENKKIILFLARLNWKKGLDTLIPSFSEIVKKEPNAVLVLAGPDEKGYKKTVDNLINQYQLKDRVIFTGLITGEILAAAYHDSQIFVLPAYSEACSISLIEALFFRLPVIITKQVGFSSEIEAAGAGILIDKNIKDLSEAILKLLGNQVFCVEMGKNGLALAKKKFSIGSVAEKFINAYNLIINADISIKNNINFQNKIRILHLIPSYLPATLASGPIKPTHSLNKSLVKNGVEVVVYTTNLDGRKILDVPFNKEVDIDGVKVFYFPITFRPWQYSYKLHKALIQNIKNFDLIHITSVFLSASTLGAYYAKKFNKPYIISPHGSLMKEPLSRGALKKKIYLKLIEKKNLSGAAAMHFLVDKEEGEYLDIGLLARKAIIVPNGINFDEFKNRPPAGRFRAKFKIPFDKKIILFLARLHPIKGLDTLIPAFAEVIKKEPNAVLVLAGPDEKNYAKYLKSQISNFNINDKVLLTGMLTGEDKVATLQDSDVFVLPSYTEAVSMSTLEAMYFGLPVVITRNSGLATIIEKGGAGLVVEKEVEQVSEAILKILNNPDLAKKMGENGRKLVEAEFSNDKVVKEFIKEYHLCIMQDTLDSMKP